MEDISELSAISTVVSILKIEFSFFIFIFIFSFFNFRVYEKRVKIEKNREHSQRENVFEYGARSPTSCCGTHTAYLENSSLGMRRAFHSTEQEAGRHIRRQRSRSPLRP